MARYPVYPPQWPPPDPATEAAIGQFVIAWGLLELQIDEAIGDILGIDHPAQTCVTANLGTKSKIEIFLSTFDRESEMFPPGMLEEVNKLGHDTATAAGVYRVWVAHGRPFKISDPAKDDEDNPEHRWIWMKAKARKGGPGGSFSLLTPEIFQRYTESTKLLIDRWNSIRSRMERGLRILKHVRRDEEDFAD
jgi:hypothetical protein